MRNGTTTRWLIGLAWALVVVGTMVPQILAREVVSTDSGVILPAQVVLLSGFLVYAAYDTRVRPLVILAVALLVAKLQFRIPTGALADRIRVSLPGGSWPILVHEAVELGITLVFVGGLLLYGYNRRDLFLRRGDLSSPVENDWLPAVLTVSWRRFSIVVGVPVILGTMIFLVMATSVASLDQYTLGELAVLGPVVVGVAAANALSEEIIYRAAPLTEIQAVMSERHALFILAGLFGLSHYYGTPGGPVGVIMTAFLAWVLAKSMLETRGLMVALTIHFLLDVLIFSTVLL